MSKMENTIVDLEKKMNKIINKLNVYVTEP